MQKSRRKRSRGGLYRRDGILCFRWKDRADVWHEKSTGETERSRAEQVKDDFLARAKQDCQPTDKAKWIVADACTQWVEQHTARLKSVKARANERSYLRQLLRRLGSRKLGTITLDDLKNYQAQRSLEVRERPINLELGILVNVLKENNLWLGSMANKAHGYRRLGEPESDVGEALSLEELSRLEAAAASRHSWLVAYCAELLASNTGMRGGEIKKLRLGVIDLENRRLRVTRKTTKTGKGARWVELNQSAFAAILRLHQRAQTLGANDADHYLLPADLSRHTKANDPLKGGRGFNPTRHQQSWDTAWRNLRRLAGLPKLRFHNCRHTYITIMAELGVPLSVTKDSVGHMSDSMTAHYTHISEKAARAAVEKLDAIRPVPHFVENFVEEPAEGKANLLN
jgi:integrase